MREKARVEVEQILHSGQALARFHGKKLLMAMCGTLRVADAGLGKPAFALSVAASPAVASRASALAGPALDQIRLFFPADLVGALADCGDVSERAILITRCEKHFDAWASGTPLPEGRERLRADLFAFARTLEEAQRSALVGLAAQVGTAS